MEAPWGPTGPKNRPSRPGDMLKGWHRESAGRGRRKSPDSRRQADRGFRPIDCRCSDSDSHSGRSGVASGLLRGILPLAGVETLVGWSRRTNLAAMVDNRSRLGRPSRSDSCAILLGSLMDKQHRSLKGEVRVSDRSGGGAHRVPNPVGPRPRIPPHDRSGNHRADLEAPCSEGESTADKACFSLGVLAGSMTEHPAYPWLRGFPAASKSSVGSSR